MMEPDTVERVRRVAESLVQIGLPPKPRFTAACNGCGLCCMLELCPVARAVYGEDAPGPCPVLVKKDGRTFCGYVQTEVAHKLEPKIQMVLGVGIGCGMRDEDTTDDEVDAFHARNELKLMSIT